MSDAHARRPPSECPVCGDAMIVTRKGCPGCGSQLTGEFASCEFCALGADDLETLRVFLASRGNLREVAKHLEVSYPTARARFGAILGRLGVVAEAEEADQDPEPDADAASPGSERDQILAQVAAGRISPADAARLLGS